MPRGPVPAHFDALLTSDAVGHLATIGQVGTPQVNPVWFIWDGQHLLLSVKADTIKYRNLRQNPALAISIVDPADSHHYLELRGVVVQSDHYRTLDFVNLLAQKYTGKDMDPAQDGLDRYKLTVAIHTWTGQ